MKNKDVILDFTSLLDIVLLILFFFILYSAFNVKESETRTEAARAEYESRLDELDREKAGLAKEREGLRSEADQLRAERDRLKSEEEKLGAEWERIRDLDQNAGPNQQALIAFNDGSMLSFHLRKDDGSEDWELRAVRRESAEGEEVLVGTIRPGDKLVPSILQLFEKAGYAEDEVLIITFTYDGNVIGTHRLYEKIMEAFRSIQAARKNVYLNPINTSK